MSDGRAARVSRAAVLGVLASVGISGICGTGSAAAQPAALQGSTYESLGRLPDWSGWWLAEAERTVGAELNSRPPPLRPEALAAIEASREANVPDPLRHCRPWQFTGSSGRFTEALEFLFTPGRVTITNERGLIRRIYTDGRPMPADLDPTNTGTSIGHWEGATLVIETAGIDPQAAYPAPGPGSVGMGENAVITERIALTDTGTLRFDVEIVAPAIFTAPDRRTQTYRRLEKTMGNEISFCSEFDRSVDPATGAQRFEMTPPPDLPPPPRQRQR